MDATEGQLLTEVTPGDYGDLDHYPVISVNAKGQLTHANSFPFPNHAEEIECINGTIDILQPSPHNTVIGLPASGALAGTYGDEDDPFEITVNEYGIITHIAPTERTAPIIESPDGTILIDQIDDATLLSMVPNIVTPGTYGNATNIPQITVDTYGRCTAVTNVPFTDAGTIYAKMMLYNQTTFTNYITTNVVTPVMPAAVEYSGANLLPVDQWILTNTSTADLSMTTNGRLQYTGATTRTFLANCGITGNITISNAVRVEIRKNGSNSGLSGNWFYSGTAAGEIVMALSCPITLATNDYISLFVGSLASFGTGTYIYCAQMTLINST